MSGSWPVVGVERDAPGRRQGRTDGCFYCPAKIGEEHARECVVVQRKVRYTVSFEIEEYEPVSWSHDDIAEHKTESSYCQGNLLDLLNSSMPEGGCACGWLTVSNVRTLDPTPIATDGDAPAALPRAT